MLIVLGRVNGGFPGSSAGKESACNAGDPVSIPGSGRSLGEGIGYLLQYSPSLENPHGQRCLAGYSPWGCKESDMTKRLSTAHRVSSEWAPYCALGPVKAFVLIALVLTTPLKGWTVPNSTLLMELRTPPRLHWKAQTCFLLFTKGFTSKPQGTELGHRVYFLLLNSSGVHFPILLQATDAKIHFHILSLWFKEILTNTQKSGGRDGGGYLALFSVMTGLVAVGGCGWRDVPRRGTWVNSFSFMVL